MINARQLRRLLEARCTEKTPSNPNGEAATGRRLFASEVIRDHLGLEIDHRGCPSWRPEMRNTRAKPEEFSLQEMAKAICGTKYDSYFDPSAGVDRDYLLQEAGSIDPTAFIDINLYSILTGGLVQARILEMYEQPEFIGTDLVETRPTNLNGEKMIGVSSIGDADTPRNPGQPHDRVDFGQRFVTTQPTTEQAKAVDVTREAVFYDLTGQVLEAAGGVGHWLAYRQEKLILQGILGVTNTYNYKGNGFNTYSATAPTPQNWINKFSNPLNNWHSFDKVLQLFSQMTDPETGAEILVSPKDVLVMPANHLTSTLILKGPMAQLRSSPNGPGGTFATDVQEGVNPLIAAGLNLGVYASAIARNVAIAASPLGLGLSPTNADIYWWAGDFKKAFAWMENWPLRVTQASPNDYVMQDRGLIVSYFSNWRGVFAVKEPRYVVVSTN